MDALDALLRWDDAGPVAILFFFVVALSLLVRWLLAKLIESKDAQIARNHESLDKMTDGIAETLDDILTTVRETRDREGRRR